MPVRIKEPALEVIDLDGPNGNAFYLMGTVSKYAKALGLDKNSVIDEMTDGDYNHLCRVFQKYLPCVVLETSNPELISEISICHAEVWEVAKDALAKAVVNNA